MAISDQDFLKAAFEGDIDLLRAYADEGGDVNVTNKHGMTALIIAIWNARPVEVARFLISRGVDLSIRQPSSDWRALTYAAVNGHREHLELLLASGDQLDPNGRDWKALMYAIQYRSIDTAEILLQHGADVNARDDEGLTPLMRAARNNDQQALEMLLRYGADPRLAANDGNTALHFAAAKASVQNIQSLIAAGAIVAAKNNSGETALSISRAKNKRKVHAYLESLTTV